ncbi:hypothetical protein [Streptosporangium sp. DT93]|uniref:hypothetical protein n=1 Tax=Streptosporangium sp. DT93 TaxID=3393428 RepID=UPI003CEC3979
MAGDEPGAASPDTPEGAPGPGDPDERGSGERGSSESDERGSGEQEPGEPGSADREPEEREPDARGADERRPGDREPGEPESDDPGTGGDTSGDRDGLEDRDDDTRDDQDNRDDQNEDARDDQDDGARDDPEYDPDVTAVIRLPLRPLPPPGTTDDEDAPGDEDLPDGENVPDDEETPEDEGVPEDDDAEAEDRSDITAEFRLPVAPLRPGRAPAGRPTPGAQEEHSPASLDPDDLGDPRESLDSDSSESPDSDSHESPDSDSDSRESPDVDFHESLDFDEPSGSDERSDDRSGSREFPGSDESSGSHESSGLHGSPAFPVSPEHPEHPEHPGPETVPAVVRAPVAEHAVTPHAPYPGPAAPPGGGSRDATPAAEPSRAANLVRTAMVWLPPLLTVEGLVMYVLALRVAPGPLWGVDLNKIDGVGLISAMPPTAFAAILLMVVAFFVTIGQNTDRKFLLLFQIAAITFALHGGAALIEDEARFHTAYVHAGFVEYINRTGESSAILDARLAWPGFFALVAFVTKAAGVTDLTTIMRWTPLLSNLLYLLPFVLILRQVVATTRARWFAALLFVIVQWIGQDYFSSQGFTYAIYLAFVAIVLRWFGKVEPRTKPMPVKGPVRRLLARLDGLTPGELPHSTGVYDRTIMLIVLIGLFATATASHQITPFMMLGALTGLILLRRSSLSWGLPFFLGLMVLAWISYQTVTFWSGHIDQLFGGLGRILENLQSNTGDRIDGSDPKHAIVLMARLGICGVILTLAAAGLFRRLRRGVGDRAALLLLCVPVLALGLQNYGGEIGLRIYLFALPGACILAAYAFFPNLPAGTEDAPEETVPIRRRNIRFNPELTRRISLLLAAGCAMALAMVFLVARYGNEQFERVSASEVAAMHYVYDHDEPSARVLYLVPVVGQEITPSIPWGERDFDKIAYREVLVDKNPAQLTSVINELRTSPPNTYLVATRGQAGYLQLNHGFPTDWAPRFRAALDADKNLKRVFNGEDAAVYTLRSFPEGTEIPDRAVPPGGNDPTSPWTPVGLAALGVTWIALFAYEVFLLRGRGRTSRTRRRILFVAIPAFVLAVAVIAERFVVIGYHLQ